MKKQIIRIIVIGLLVITSIALFKPFEQFKLNDRYIRFNISSEISMLDLVLKDLTEVLLTDEAYKTLDIELMHEEVLETRYKLSLIDRSISMLFLLNREYEFDLHGVSDYIDELEHLLKKNRRPTDAEIDVLVTINAIISKYHNATVISYYEYDDNGFTRLDLPEKTKLLFEELNKIEISE